MARSCWSQLSCSRQVISCIVCDDNERFAPGQSEGSWCWRHLKVVRLKSYTHTLFIIYIELYTHTRDHIIPESTTWHANTPHLLDSLHTVSGIWNIEGKGRQTNEAWWAGDTVILSSIALGSILRISVQECWTILRSCYQVCLSTWGHVPNLYQTLTIPKPTEYIDILSDILGLCRYQIWYK